MVVSKKLLSIIKSHLGFDDRKKSFNMLCASEKGEVALWFWIQCNPLQSFYIAFLTYQHGGSTSVLHLWYFKLTRRLNLGVVFMVL